MTANAADFAPGFNDRLPEVNFALVLARIIDQIRADPSQLRDTVYELARVTLEKETAHRDPPPSPEEKQRLMSALEVAIEGVENFSSREVTAYLPPYGGNGSHALPAPLHGGERKWTGGPEPMLGVPERIIVIDSPRSEGGAGPGAFSSVRSLFGPLLAAIALVAIGMGVLAASNRDLVAALKSEEIKVAAAIAASRPAIEPPGAILKVTSDPQLAGVPLPTVYGVYALNNEQFHELDVLPARVPDPRIRISTPIVTPSRTVLSDGRVNFLVFRRDFSSSAPDRITVRAIAKVTRTLRFDPTGVASAAAADLWTIRSNAYEFRVAPLRENAEMFVLRSDQADFTLPAGRYALVLKGQGYDFAVAGPVTDPAQCLEQVEAANGTFYSECRAP